MVHFRFVRVAALVWLATYTPALTGCDDDEDDNATAQPATQVGGPQADLFGSPARVWTRLDADTGEVSELGLTISLDSINGAPAAADVAGVLPPTVLALPVAARGRTFIDHVEINWNPAGHPPAPYAPPHFDLHFYGIPPSAVTAIDCSDLRLPPAAEVPENYVIAPPGPPPDGDCVPQMGLHAVDVTSPELASGQPFTATMVLGYYGGELIFVEPMVTQARLQDTRSFVLPIPLPTRLGQAARLPTSLRATYQPEIASWEFVLTDFRQVQAR